MPGGGPCTPLLFLRKAMKTERRILDRQKEYGRTAQGLFNHAKAQNKRRGLVWSITSEQFKYLLSEGCFVMNCRDRVTGLDRIDNSLGYFFKNVRPSCVMHNSMRNIMVDEEFYKKCKEVVVWYESLIS